MSQSKAKSNESTLSKVYKGVKTGVSVASTAMKAYKLASFVASMLNVEYKNFDVNVTPATFTNAGTIGLLTGFGQGTGATDRNGNKVKAVSLYLNTSIYASSAATTPTEVRLVLFRDWENRQANPAVTDILTIADINSPLAPNAGDRFEIIKDMRFTLDASKGISMFRKFFYKLPHKRRIKGQGQMGNPHLNWIGTSTGVANIDEGHFFYMVLSNQPTNSPTYKLYSRLRYIDN